MIKSKIALTGHGAWMRKQYVYKKSWC